ncbi:MAG: thioredoxin-disulfide reductase [Bacteroidales bacterium]|nr:thioredoxin-disulfide reductase [Bacteroidales bacterium]MCI2122044.1 thioredoxin-disulfide reductase [Bacteroidales bacterium]MCI2145341.1 thioredoxin-disulfide reductase [Bacteroidales bacterium]
MEEQIYKVLIIGSGPAGFTAAIYACRANLNPVLYEGMQPGGQLTETTRIENFPGYPEGVDGNDLMEDLRKQAIRLGADIRFGAVTKVDFSKRPFLITVDDEKVVMAHSVIIATGATARYLGLESETRFRGQGVSACATCDGFFYRGKTVAVVGGGDTACEEATYLATLAKKVYMVVRRDVFRASETMRKRVESTPNIEVLWNHNTKEVLGDSSGVTGVRLLNNKTGNVYDLPVDGFFLAIGHHPNSDVFKEYITTNPEGYIVTEGKTSKTNVEGVFAAGDVQDPSYRQAVTAAGSGCKAGLDAERFLACYLPTL